MAITFGVNGPLTFASLYRVEDCDFFDKTRPPEIKPAADDEPYLVKIGDRLDLLAFTKLGDSDRGWIILLRNDLRLMPNDLVPGSTIMIPTLASLQSRKIIK